MNERTSYETYLMYKASGGEYTKLVDIKDFPDLGGEPERVEITTLSDPMRRYLKGIQDTESIQFTANYTKADYSKIVAIDGIKDFAVYFGEDGADGMFKFSGEISVFAKGAGVNDPVEMTITIVPNTVISFE